MPPSVKAMTKVRLPMRVRGSQKVYIPFWPLLGGSFLALQPPALIHDVLAAWCCSCRLGQAADRDRAGDRGSAVPRMAGKIAGVVGAGVVGPGERAGGAVVADREVGDLRGEVGAGGELAAAQQAAGQGG